MKVLLASTASYVPPRGGSTRSNLVWLDHLASAGHECRVVCAAAVHDTPGRKAQVDRELEQQEIRDSQVETSPGVVRVRRGAVDVFSVEEPSRQKAVLHDQIGDFKPDWVLVSSEDLGHVLLREAAASAAGRVVYIAHTPQFFPFGPASWNPDVLAAALVKRCAGVVAIGHHMAGYIHQHSGIHAAVIHPPIYGSEPYPQLGRFDGEFITMVNPCAVKGISVFVALARAHPGLAFAALPGWGTTSADRDELTALPNVTILANCKHIEQCLSRTRILLMPSLWYEGFGLIAMEAMLRGIPVVSSDSGGLKEAKQGSHFIIPVRPITQYEPVFDEQRMPRPVIEQQDLGPWSEALRVLTTDRTHYEREAEDSRRVALAFVRGLRAGQFTDYLEHLQPAAVSAATTSDPAAMVEAAFQKLTPEKRELLLARLKKDSGTVR